jgi:HAMP domain-containing protein
MSKQVNDTPRRMSLKWKIMGGLTSAMILFGLLVIGIVNYRMTELVHRQLDQRALDLAVNLGDSAAGRVLKGEVLELYALIAKYSLSPGVAYTVVRDGQGAVVANSLGTSTLPPELNNSSLSTAGPTRRELEFRGRTVYETSVPILQGRVGSASVGFWSDSLAAEVRGAVLPVIGLIALALAASVILSLVVARGITARMMRLKEVADKVSKGDLETPVGIDSNDEIGDLAHSLERMRASLRAAMARLSRA